MEIHDNFVANHPGVQITGSIINLLESEEDALIFMYVGKIRWFLSEDLKQLHSLIKKIPGFRNQSIEFLDNAPHESTQKENEIKLDINPEISSNELKDVMEEYETLKKIGVEDFEKEFQSNNNEPYNETNEKEVKGEDSDEFRRLFNEEERKLQVDEIENKRTVGGHPSSFSVEERQALFDFIRNAKNEGNELFAKEIIKVSKHMTDFLRTRLRVLRRWTDLFHQKHINFDNPLSSLVNNYVDLLSKRNSLIYKQIEMCQKMTESLKQDESDIRVYTINAEETLKDNNSKLEKLQALAGVFQWIIKANTKTKPSDLHDQFELYDQTMSRLIDDIDNYKSWQLNPEDDRLI